MVSALSASALSASHAGMTAGSLCPMAAFAATRPDGFRRNTRGPSGGGTAASRIGRRSASASAGTLVSTAPRRTPYLFVSEGLGPSDSPTRALARRFAASLRSRGSLAVLVRNSSLELEPQAELRLPRNPRARDSAVIAVVGLSVGIAEVHRVQHVEHVGAQL